MRSAKARVSNASWSDRLPSWNPRGMGSVWRVDPLVEEGAQRLSRNHL